MIGLSADELARVFPFHFVLGRDLRVVQIGRSLTKLVPGFTPGAHAAEQFTLERPSGPLTYETLRDRCAEHCLLRSRDRRFALKGHFLANPGRDELLFLGSPRVANAGELAALDLTVRDFAVHDAIVDFLFLSHAQESTLADAHALTERLQEERGRVREAHNRLTTLYVVSRVLAESESLEVGLAALTPALAKTLGCAGASQWRLRGNDLVCQAAYPQILSQPPALPLTRSRGLLANVLVANEPIWLPAGFGVDDGILDGLVAMGDDIDPPTIRRERVVRPPDTAVCGLPIRRGAEVIGVIALAMPTTIRRPDDLLYLLGEITTKLEQFSDRLVAAEQLAAARDAALASVRAKSAFLANVSHEIRTPLGAVLGLASVLRGMQLEDSAYPVVDDIHDAGTTLLRLVDDLLDEARIEAGKLSIVASPFDLREATRVVIEPLQIKAAARGVRLSLDVDRSVHGDVVGDRVRVSQIISNLVGNAVKFTEVGHVHVRVFSDEEGITLVVADTGIGIAPAQLQRIFEPFTQVDDSTTRRFGGAGLGLTITRRLIDAMGGTLAVDSALGRGSTFTVKLPLERVEAAPVPAMSASVPRGVARHILVVEDNEVGQRAVRLLLEQLGHTVDVVADGMTAVLAAERIAYDLVLMDCHLPGLDGFEATRRIRALPGRAGRVPIVACTASVLIEERERCIAVGMNDVLTKPLSPEALRRVTDGAPLQRSTPVATTSAVLDFERLALLRGLGSSTLGQLLAAFCEHAPAHLAALEAARVTNDAGAVRRAAHALHGMSLNVGAAAVARACADVERAAAAGTVLPPDAIRFAYQQTLAALASAHDA